MLYEEIQTISESDEMPLHLWKLLFVATQLALMADRLTKPRCNGFDNEYKKSSPEQKENFKSGEHIRTHVLLHIILNYSFAHQLLHDHQMTLFLGV